MTDQLNSQEEPRPIENEIPNAEDMGEGFDKPAEAEEEKKKKPRKPLFKISPEYLTENPNGLKALYKMFVIDKKFTSRGKGHELSDFNKLMNLYKNWHYQAGLKLEYPYFIERVQKVGNDKQIRAYMNRLRKHYKGEELMEELQLLEGKLPLSTTEQENKA